MLAAINRLVSGKSVPVEVKQVAGKSENVTVRWKRCDGGEGCGVRNHRREDIKFHQFAALTAQKQLPIYNFSGFSAPSLSLYPVPYVFGVSGLIND